LSFLPFHVFSFIKSHCRVFIANDEWPPIHLISVGWIISFWAMLESYHKSQRKPKTVFEFKDAPQLTRSALREKAMDAGVKDYGR